MKQITYLTKMVAMTIFVFLDLVSFGQSLADLPLDDLSAFKAQDGNWSIIGAVSMDLNKDVHEFGNGSIITSPGKGILVNKNSESAKSNLITKMEHGDIEIEFDFMMPKGSNSGFYLQGRYEIQLFDSWGAKDPKYSDLGGIYRNWETEKGSIYLGKAPLANTAKAPGLWQKMYISFSAPRFDASGKKIENAKINLAKINGTIIHENIEIPMATGGPVSKIEVAKGPIMIQGDHGGVAFKNIKYRLINNEDVKISNVNYKYYKGKFNYEKEYQDLKPDKIGNSPEGITWEMSEVSDFFALHLTGDMEIPTDDNYYFSAVQSGSLALYVDNDTILKNKLSWDWDGLRKSEPTYLKKGKHKLDIYYSRSNNWRPPSIGLYIASDHMRNTPKHAFSSFLQNEVSYPLMVDASSKPTILRAFFDFDQKKELRRTHTIGVGDPSGIQYIFDNDLGAISCVWKGDFVDATPMWNSRGDGSFLPVGQPIYLDNTLQFDILSEDNQLFNTQIAEDQYKAKSYEINPFTKTPIFNYRIADMAIRDEIYPDVLTNALIREVKIAGDMPKDLAFRTAHGTHIDVVQEGVFNIDGKYYIKLETTNPYYIKKSGDLQELIVKMNSPQIRYQIIW